MPAGNPRERIQTRLANHIMERQAEFAAALADLRKVVFEVPSGAYGPDGALTIRQASAIRLNKLTRHRQALKRYNEFILSGKTPQDLG